MARVRERSGVDRNLPVPKIGLVNQTWFIRPVHTCDWLDRADRVCGTFFALTEKNLLDGALSPRCLRRVTAGSEGDTCYRHHLGICGARKKVQPGAPALDVSGSGCARRWGPVGAAQAPNDGNVISPFHALWVWRARDGVFGFGTGLAPIAHAACDEPQAAAPGAWHSPSGSSRGLYS